MSRLGAMVSGGVSSERLVLNDSTFWLSAVEKRVDIPAGASTWTKLGSCFFRENVQSE